MGACGARTQKLAVANTIMYSTRPVQINCRPQAGCVRQNCKPHAAICWPYAAWLQALCSRLCAIQLQTPCSHMLPLCSKMLALCSNMLALCSKMLALGSKSNALQHVVGNCSALLVMHSNAHVQRLAACWGRVVNKCKRPTGTHILAGGCKV